jgi:hypothetical protein
LIYRQELLSSLFVVNSSSKGSLLIIMSSDDRGAERSSVEIKTLVRKLHPKRGNHKDRIRSLNKFRNYVIGPSGSNSRPPEFYDDDLPLLWLGAAAPAVYLEEVNDDLLAMGIYGLLQACGAPSDDHDASLKRSARHATNLLKWLLLDWREGKNETSNRNLFCRSFLSLEVRHYQHMQLDLHCIGEGDRGGAKEDAMHILVLVLTSHTSEDGEASRPLMVEDLLRSAKAQQEFELWTARNAPAAAQEAIKRNAAARQGELALQQRQDALASKAHGASGVDAWGGGDDEAGGGGGGGGGGAGGHDASDRDKDDGSDNAGHTDRYLDGDDDPDYYGAAGDYDPDDVVAAMRKRNRQVRRQVRLAEGREGGGPSSSGRAGGGGAPGPARRIATRWEDCQVAREQRARAAAAAQARARQNLHETVRDSQQAAHELLEREEERAKVLGKDPLGIIARTSDEFDLSTVESSQAQLMERALAELQEEAQKAESSSGNDRLVKKAMGKKESIEALVARLGGLEAMENASTLQLSVLPTSPNFDPLLFLTLVHRKTKFETLKGSMDKLSSM